jgi:glycogen debranching enzyme
VLQGALARSVVDLVEARLVTPLGLRTLSPDDPAYIGIFHGDAYHRDHAYHQGTTWPWLAGPFVDAWLSVRGRTDAAKAEARRRFLAPLMEHLQVSGLGHVSEVADGDPPHIPGGCPFQAWSLGELIRIRKFVDAD